MVPQFSGGVNLPYGTLKDHEIKGVTGLKTLFGPTRLSYEFSMVPWPLPLTTTRGLSVDFSEKVIRCFNSQCFAVQAAGLTPRFPVLERLG